MLNLPDNSSEIERWIAKSLRRDLDLSAVSELLNPEICPVHLLGWLAWSLSVDEWDPNWPEARKRAVCAASVEVHRRKGTVSAMRIALAAVDTPCNFEEWFEVNPQREPGTFRIWIDADAMAASGLYLTIASYARLRLVANSVKPVSAHYDIAARAKPIISARVGIGLVLQRHITVGAAA